MLPEQDVRLVKWFYLLSAMTIPAFVMTFVTLGLWFVLVFTDDFIFQASGFYVTGVYAMIGIVIFYMTVFVYGMLRVRFGIQGKRWKSITQNLALTQGSMDFSGKTGWARSLSAAGRLWDNQALQTAGAMETVSVTSEIASDTSKKIRAVMERGNITMSAAGYILALILLPCLLLTGVYIPELQQSRQAMEQRITRLSEVMETLTEAFEAEGYLTYFYDVREDAPYYTFGAYVYPEYAEREVHEMSCSLSLEFSDAGILQGAAYDMDLTGDYSPEEYIGKFHAAISDMNSVLQSVEPGKTAKDLLSSREILEEIASEYIEGGGQKDSYVKLERKGIAYTFSYRGEETQDPYVYHTVERISQE